MTTKQVFRACAVACAMASVAAFADAPTATEESFESFNIATLNSGTWWGFGSLLNDSAKNPAAGYPLKDAAHTKSFKVEGFTICSNETLTAAAADNFTQVEMMIKVSKPEEALTAEVFEGDAVPQIAVAVDPACNLCVYMKNGTDETNGWYAIKSGLTEGAWVRVGFVMDYANGRCKIALDGELLSSADYGFAKATGDEKNGAWYPLIGSAAQLKSVKVCGLTAIDDVVAKQVAKANYEPSYKDSEGNDKTVTGGGETFTLAELDKAGVDSAKLGVVLNETSGMTAAAKLVAGLDPYDATKFEITGMTVNGDNATFTFPGGHVVGKYSIKYGTAAGSLDGALEAEITKVVGDNGMNTATVSFSGLVDLMASGNVLYFEAQATK